MKINMSEIFLNRLTASAAEMGLSLDGRTAAQLYTYYEMLVEKNKVMNLTAITGEEDAVTKHFIDSLSIVKCPGWEELLKKAPGKEAPHVIDIGTGAGFPGLVLKIAFPEIRMVLFDSLKKRLNFLDEVIEALGLEGVETVHGRAEDAGHDKKHREQYDLAVSRAVANMATLSEYCLPFVKKGGCFAAYKTAESGEEVAAGEGAVRKLGGTIERSVSFTLPMSDIGRSLVLVRKTGSTPSKYPRKAGTPGKDPLS